MSEPSVTAPTPNTTLRHPQPPPGGHTVLTLALFGNENSGRSITLDFVAHVLASVPGVEVVEVDHRDHEMVLRLPPGAKTVFDGLKLVLPNSAAPAAAGKAPTPDPSPHPNAGAPAFGHQSPAQVGNIRPGQGGGELVGLVVPGRHWRRKAGTVEAIQWDGSEDGAQAIADAYGDAVQLRKAWDQSTTLKCCTRNGWLSAAPRDWIIRREPDDVYSCPPDVFAASYEPASPAPSPQGGGEKKPAE